jgi:hypothetical protein
MVPCRWRSALAIERSSSTFVRNATLNLQAVPSFGVSTAAISGRKKMQRWAEVFGLYHSVPCARGPIWRMSQESTTTVTDDDTDGIFVRG